MLDRRTRTYAGLWTALAALLLVGSAHADTPRLLLPDLRQEIPTEITLSSVGGQTRLGFRSATDNVGAGPVIVEGRRRSRRAPFMTATQVIRLSDGSTLSRPRAGRLQFIRLHDHRHWHLADFMRYELRRARDFKMMRPGLKTGFCVGDRMNLDIFSLMPGEPDHAIYTSECGLHRPGLLNVHEGLSVGHADYYAANLEGQYMDITKLRSGRYWLVHRANPEHLLRESDLTNNAASLLLDIQHQFLANGHQRVSVTVLRACPDSARCGPSSTT